MTKSLTWLGEAAVQEIVDHEAGVAVSQQWVAKEAVAVSQQWIEQWEAAVVSQQWIE